jgi:hypothetical protein
MIAMLLWARLVFLAIVAALVALYTWTAYRAGEEQ